METGKAIYKLLKDNTDVGDICADRIYPELAQQDADAPFIVYTVVDTTPSPTKNATSKLDTARVELYCLSDDYEQAMDLGIAVRSALDRQSGTIAGVEVQSIDFDTSDIQFDPDQRIYVLEHTYDVRVQRTGTAVSVAQFPGNTLTVEEVDGTPTGAVNKLVFSNGTVTLDGNTATITNSSGGTWEGLSYITPAAYLNGGASAVNYTNTAPRAIDFGTRVFDVSTSVQPSSTDAFRVEVTGYYRVTVNATFTSTAARITPIVEIEVDGRAVEGQGFGYIRASNGQNENSCSVSRLLNIPALANIQAVAYDSSTVAGNVFLTQAVIDIERMA